MDGATYAAIGKNATQMGHWLVPYYNEESYPRFAEHPPFYFMYIGLVFKLFGTSWTTARLSVLLLNIVTFSFVWLSFKKLSSKRHAFLTLLILLLCYPFIRKCRYPLLETPLLLFSTLTLITYYKAFLFSKTRYFLLAGVFWGCALLMKGHAAFFIPLTIFLHLILTKNLSKLLDFRLWLALFLGFLVFSLWPLSLSLTNNFDIFTTWFQRQFTGTVIQARGKAELDLFVYLEILLFQCLPWLLLSLWGSWKIFKEEKRDHFGFLFMAWFLAILLPYSFMKWKYSHYIHPIYLPMSALAAFAFLYFKEKSLSTLFKQSKSSLFSLFSSTPAFP